MKDRTRGILGTLRALPDVNRRLFQLEQNAERDAANKERLGELEQRLLALTHQLDHMNALVSQVDPVATAQMAAGVRDSVRELSIELTEQANQTSELLAELTADRD